MQPPLHAIEEPEEGKNRKCEYGRKTTHSDAHYRGTGLIRKRVYMTVVSESQYLVPQNRRSFVTEPATHGVDAITLQKH